MVRQVGGWAIWVHFPSKCPQQVLPYSQGVGSEGPSTPERECLGEGDALLGYALKAGLEGH